jgi:hypothetical protein
MQKRKKVKLFITGYAKCALERSNNVCIAKQTRHCSGHLLEIGAFSKKHMASSLVYVLVQKLWISYKPRAARRDSRSRNLRTRLSLFMDPIPPEPPEFLPDLAGLMPIL